MMRVAVGRLAGFHDAGGTSWPFSGPGKCLPTEPERAKTRTVLKKCMRQSRDAPATAVEMQA